MDQVLKPKLPKDVTKKLKYQKPKQSSYYNHGSKELSELCPGDAVRVKPLKPTEKT